MVASQKVKLTHLFTPGPMNSKGDQVRGSVMFPLSSDRHVESDGTC